MSKPCAFCAERMDCKEGHRSCGHVWNWNTCEMEYPCYVPYGGSDPEELEGNARSDDYEEDEGT